MTVTYVAAFLVSLIVSLVATPIARRIALAFGWLDRPGVRKSHADPVPYLGGAAIVLAFVIAVAAGALAREVQAPYAKAAVLLGGGLLLAGVGLWDDLRDLPAWPRLVIEIGLGLALFAVDVRTHLFGGGPVDLALTVAWVVGITNATNYVDNMDGLSAGVSFIAAAYFFGLAADAGLLLVAGLSAALAGCALGFLWHNRPPARIFMGDAGSLFLGFVLAALGLELEFDNIARVTFFVPVAVMAVPILDVVTVSASRLRLGRPVLVGGKDHISHRLVSIGLSSRAALALLYLAAASCGWLGVVIAYAQPRTAYMLMSWLAVLGGAFVWMLLRVRVGP